MRSWTRVSESTIDRIRPGLRNRPSRCPTRTVGDRGEACQTGRVQPDHPRPSDPQEPELDVEGVARALREHDYLADEGLATAIFLAVRLRRPLLLEGEAGVGKTEVAKVLAQWTGGELIRLQCYEGIDVSQAVYEWDYSRQLLHLRAAEASGQCPAGRPLER